MIILLVASALFVLIAVTLGNWVSVAVTGTKMHRNASVFEALLIGYAFLCTYLNLWSFILPVNYYSLFPVFILSIVVRRHSIEIPHRVKRFAANLVYSGTAIPAALILLVVILYALLPPQHGDSPGYHFLTIRWNETYKAIPGLANLHGRLGFNSSFFVSSAAFAFSGITHQPLYVVNIVFALAYYCWLIHKMHGYRNTLWSVVFLFLALAMFRQLIDSISSPTPDVLSTIIISYIFVTIAEKLLNKTGFEKQQNSIIILLICFALTIKLNTFPLVLIAIFLFLQHRVFTSRKSVLTLLALGSVIIIPWMVRTYILTGYLIFPVSATGFFNPDWKVPYKILHHEKLLINNGPKMISQNWEAVDALSYLRWFPLWIEAHFKEGLSVSLVILTVAVLSGIVTLVMTAKNKYAPLFWLAVINCISIAFWIYNSPDYRFGYPYLANNILLLSLFLARHRLLPFYLKKTVPIIVVITAGYYLTHAIKILSPYPVSTYVLKPLQASQYTPNRDATGFPFIMLNNEQKLYIEDEQHWCNFAPLPCLIPYADSFPIRKIKFRGKNVTDGFKISGQ